jgi:PEP-CTERM motif
MRRLLPCCLLFLALLPIAAHADTLTFTLDNSITWTLTNPPDEAAINANDLFILQFPIDFNGNKTTAELDLLSSAVGGGFNLTYFFPGGPGHIAAQGVQLFSGTTADPTILLGDFTLTDGKGFDTLSITSDATAPTPEPSTFALLAIGFIGALTAVPTSTGIRVIRCQLRVRRG